MTAAVYEKVRAYHEQHGDDVASDQSRHARYDAIRSLLPAESGKTLLDVGCGTRAFRPWVPTLRYTGVDLLEGVNVLDLEGHFDLVVGNGIVYKLPDERAAKRLLAHCWSLADSAFVFTSLNYWEHFHREELSLDPYSMLRWAHKLCGKTAVRMDYKAGDFCLAMYRR